MQKLSIAIWREILCSTENDQQGKIFFSNKLRQMKAGQNNKYDIAKSWNFVQAYEYEDHISTFWLFPTFNKEDSDGTANSDPEAMQQKSLRMPLVVTGIGLQEQAEHNVTETESTTNFTEKHGEQFISLFGHFGVFVLL